MSASEFRHLGAFAQWTGCYIDEQGAYSTEGHDRHAAALGHGILVRVNENEGDGLAAGRRS